MPLIAGPKLRSTFGKVVSYNSDKGFGWIVIGDELHNDAFISHRDFEPQKDCKKHIDKGQVLKFDLHQNKKGYVAKNAVLANDKEYKKFLAEQGVFR